MNTRVHPSQVSTLSSRELRELQKLHELGKKYWPAEDKKRYEEEETRPEPRRGRYLFRHPYSRLATAYLVVFCNFLIFAEDPVSHSYRECVIDVIGEIYTFMFIRWPRGSFSLIKFSCWMVAIVLGCCVGKSIIHGWFFCKKLKLTIFTEDGQGSWMVMFLTSLLSLFIFSFAYNGFLMLEGKYMDKMHASHRMGMENQTFMKVAAICTWLGDFITAWMVTDMMLQGMQYAHWAPGLRRFWKKGLNRVYAFWFVFVSMTIVVSTAISTDYVNWDRLNRDFVASNEISRAFLASFILVMDLMIVMQDWDFPHFAGSLDIKLPGVNSDAFDVQLPTCCGGKPMDIYITGKWFNYGIIFIVMILDLNMWKNQIFYDPFTYGQYTDPEGYIYTVSDRQFLRWGNETLMTYEWRWNHINPKTNRTYGLEDVRMNSKFKGYSLTLKGIAFVPSIFTFCLFGYLVWLFGSDKNPDEVLVRRYRRDTRLHRQMKRLKKQKKLEEKRSRELARQQEEAVGWPRPFTIADGLGRAALPATTAANSRRNEDIIDMSLFDGGEPDHEHEEDVTQPEEKAPEVKKNFTYYFRHPYFRIATSYLVVFCNFLIFAEDPVSHSYTDCIIDIIGNMYGFVFSRYPPEAGFIALKVFMYLFAAGLGMFVGKFFIHKFLLCRVLKLRMFSEDGQGSWMVMFLTVLMFLFIISFIYNELLLLGGAHLAPYVTSHNLGIENQTFMKMAAIGTWLGDFITAWMVTDMMLQEDQYPQWSPGLRKFWRRGRNRVYAFWLISFGMSAVVATAITTDYVNWDEISKDFMPTNEISRAYLASFILVMDLFIVMQDWDFPYFDGGLDIKLPGLNTGNFHFHLPGGDIRISGKWFNYGIIFIVMILDLNMWKNQIFYDPFTYGQYTDDQHYIYTVSDRDFLANATTETLSYAWRWTHVNPLTNKTYGSEDQKMNSRYLGYPLSAKGTAFIPSLFVFTMFGILVKYFSKGGPPAKLDPKDEKDPADEEAETRNSNNDVTGDAVDSSSSPRVAASRQSMSSYKSDFTLNKTKNLGSFLSMESSRDGLNLARDNFDSSRDNLNSSRDYFDSSRDNLNNSRDELRSSCDNLESSRDDLRSSVESLGVVRRNTEQSPASRPAWSADSPMKALPDKTKTRRDSSATEKSAKRRDSSAIEKSARRRQSSNSEQDCKENMVQELVQELDFLNLEDGETQSKETKPAEENVLSVGDNKDRALSFGDLFRQESPGSQLSVATSDEENDHVGVKPAAKATKHFLQVPKAK